MVIQDLKYLKSQITNHESRTDPPELKAPRPKPRNQAIGGLDRIETIGARVLVVAVVDHDDAARRGAVRQTRYERVGGLAPEPVEVPHHPSPAHHAVTSPRGAPHHRHAAPAGVRSERMAGR